MYLQDLEGNKDDYHKNISLFLTSDINSGTVTSIAKDQINVWNSLQQTTLI